MFAKKNRLQLRQQPNFFTTSERYFTRYLTFFYLRSPAAASFTISSSPQPAQIAIIIPKKSVKLATARHAWKRQLVLALKPSLDQLSGFHLAISATPHLASATPEEISTDLQKFLHHIA